MIKFSIVIPVFNSEKFIANTLEAILNQTGDEDEIIIVDDGSTDGTADIIKKYPVKYIYQNHAGSAKARNTGWQNASGEIICFTDSDCLPERKWISKLLDHYTSCDIVGVGGSYYIFNNGSFLSDCIHQEIVYRHSKISGDTDFLGSFNVSYRKKTLEQLGGFDDSFRHASGEDNDLSYRIKKRGYRLVFDKDIKVGHYYPSKLFRYLRSQFWHGFWRVKLYRKHPDMAKGDRYAGIQDFIQPPLALLTVFLSPFAFWGVARIILLCALTCEIILQLPIPVMIIVRTQKIKYLFLAFVTFLRAFARGFGLFFGVIKFYMLRQQKQ